ncbi:MAG TPA: ABC transporter permease [Bryobacteraceae bacterium]|nr:ABC transporter permease [Bryobacteraceae bacterium]
MWFLKEVLAEVVTGLLRNKLRSFLTMAGIAWGVASIVLIVAMGDGFKLGQRDRFRSIGENIAVVFPGRTEKQAGGQRAGRLVRPTYDDLQQIRAECFLVSHAVAELMNSVHAVSAFNSGLFSVVGVEPLYAEVRNIQVDRGRFFTDSEADAGARVAILGDNVRKQLFGDRPVSAGLVVALNGLPFRVVGFMPPKDQNSGYNGMDSDKIYAPYQAVRRDLPPPDATFEKGILNDFVYVPRSLEFNQAARAQIMRVLARNHHFEADDESAVHIWDTVEDAKLVDRIFTSMTAFLGVIALVTLTLGGVGVMNIMLVSVSERTREIGLRKAVGATRRRILAEFMLEGVLLAVVSGLGGWAGAFGVAAAVNSLPKVDMFGGLPVSGLTTALAFSALAIISLISAFVPAWRAASMPPVEALRYER